MNTAVEARCRPLAACACGQADTPPQVTTWPLPAVQLRREALVEPYTTRTAPLTPGRSRRGPVAGAASVSIQLRVDASFARADSSGVSVDEVRVNAAISWLISLVCCRDDLYFGPCYFNIINFRPAAPPSPTAATQPAASPQHATRPVTVPPQSLRVVTMKRFHKPENALRRAKGALRALVWCARVVVWWRRAGRGWCLASWRQGVACCAACGAWSPP